MREIGLLLFSACVCVDSGWDSADTQRVRAAVRRRSIHVLGILCFRLPALLRCLVTTQSQTGRGKLWKSEMCFHWLWRFGDTRLFPPWCQ